MDSSSLSYEPVEAFADTSEDRPGPRCGHTLTPIFANDSHQLLLFGGTNLADRNSVFGINLQGVTNSVHCFDVSTRRWKRLNTCGNVPSPRACHAATAVFTKFLIQGGINQNGLCDGHVYMLEMAGKDLRWSRLNFEGATPSPRYGHVMGIANHMWVVIFGGATGIGNLMLSDTWAMDTRTPDMWHKLNPSGNLPCGRMFASSCTRRTGGFWLFGGRDHLGRPLGDAYELDIFTIKQSSWIVNASIAPSPRCQHSAVFYGTRMHVIGGVVTWNNLVNREAVVDVLNTETGKWLERDIRENLQYKRLRRWLHAAASIEGRIYVYGGRRSGELLLEDLLVSVSSHRPIPVLQDDIIQSFINSLSNGH